MDRAFRKKAANDWQWESKTALTQAYRLYLLAQAGSPEMGAMNRLRQQQRLEGVAKWSLAGAYYLVGQKNVAKQLTAGLSLEVEDYQELSNTFGNKLRDQALMLQMLSVMEQRNRTTPLVRNLSAGLSSDKWYSTQTTSFGLVAMAKYIGKNSDKTRMKFSWRQQGGTWQKVNADEPFWQMKLPYVRPDEIEIRNDGNNVLYPRLVLRGVPLQGDTRTSSNGLDMKVRYTTLNGQAINPERIEQGTDFIAEVTLKNTGTQGIYKEMALTHIFPSGWEIYNSRMDGVDNGGDSPEYMDIRDDRVDLFYDLAQGKSKTFKVRLNASYLGRYYLPTVASEAMYDKRIHARTGGQWVEVVNVGEG